MNAPVLLAQLSGSTQAPTPKTLKIAKPGNAQALSFHLDGNTRLDFSDISSEKLTFVKVGEKLIVLFDNQSTVTIDPVFDSATGNPLADIGFQVGDRTLDGTEFAALFPIGTDQSVLPAAGGNASGPTGGANFSDAQVNGLGPGGNPLALLGDEQFGGPEFGVTEAGVAPIGIGTAVVGAIDDEGLSDGIEGGPGDAPGHATSVINASLNLNFGSLGTSGATLAFLTSQPELSGLTSGGHPINLLISNTPGGTPTIIGFIGDDPNAPGSHVFEITLGLTTNTGEYSFTLLRPLDHPVHGTEDTISLIIHYSATNAAGTVFPDFTVNVNDDSPDLNPAGFDQPVSQGEEISVPHSDLKDPVSGTSVRGGTLGILWGADNFNDNVDGGVSQTTGQNGDRSLIFTNTTVNLSSGETSLTSGLYSHGEQVHFVLQDNGTLLVAFTGESPGESNIVFTVKLHDTNSGSYVFTQYQELDHVGSSGEGEEAQSVNLSSLNLSFHYTATDSDGDSIEKSFSVTVGDDAPTINASGIQDGNVDEDYLTNGNVGDTYNPASGTSDYKFTGNLGVSWGADDNNSGAIANRSLAFNGIVEGAAATDHGGNAILSHDQTVLLHLTTIGGQPALVGYTGADADNQSNWVFKVTLDDSSSTGSYTFTLLKPIDHPTSNAEDNIQIDFGFTATDADGDPVSSTFHVTVNDDAPVQTSATITGTAAEDDLADFNPLYPLVFDFWQGSLGTSPYDGSSDNSHTGLLGTVPVWGNLSSLVKPGADGPGEFHLVSESQAESVLAHLGPGGTALSSHGDVINDVRMVDIPNVGEAMGFFASDGRLVFGLFVDASGNYNFRLFDQLDHPIGDNPNTTALESIKDTLNIDLSQFVTYTDFDNDTITLTAGAFSVNVVDDTPVVVGHEAVTANENDLANFNPLYPLVFDFWQGSLGSSPYDGATDDSSYSGLLGTVTAWGTLADNIKGGADEFGKFELVSENRANEILATLGADGGPLKSHGDVINDARMVDIPGLGEVMGFFASDGRLVFGLFVSENGVYNFRLFDQLDHAAPTQTPDGAPVADENSLDIDLSKFVTYTDYDHDTVDLGTNTFVVTVVDDIPHIIGSLNVTLDESHLNNFLMGWDLIPAAIKDLYPVEGSSGTNPNADTDFLLNTTSQQGFLDEVIGNNVVHGGADEFGKFGVVSAGRADDVLENMGLFSKGEAIDHVKLVDIAGLGTVMGFFAGDRVVFTLTVTEAGFYDLRLFDQVDHTGANGTSLNIDLSKFVTYTDFDGDVIDLGTSHLVLTVLDDAPVPVTGAQVFGTVEEEQIDLINSVLGADMGHGNEDTGSAGGDDQDTDSNPLSLGSLATSNITIGSLASLVKVGADENGTFSFDATIAGTQVKDSTGAAVTSHGDAVVFGFKSGQLVGYVDTDHDGQVDGGERVVFTVSLNDINPLDNVNNDLFTFTLLDAIDHNNPNGLSTEDLKNLDLSKAIRFTDYDGDSTGFATNSFQIKVIDDAPRQTGSTIKGTVEEEHNVGTSVPEMNHGNEDVGPDPADGDFNIGPLNFFDVTTNKVSGNLGSLVSVGGDEVSRGSAIGPFYGTFSFGQTTSLPVVMSKGEQVLYALSDTNGDGLNDTLIGSTAGGRPVFTLTIVNNTGGGKTAGDYVFTLLDQIDHPAGGGENIANIDFSSVIRFSDYDGDTITLTNGSFSIDVIDDQPVSKGDVVDTDDVLDDEGQTTFVPANTGGTGDETGQKTVATGGAKSLFSIGADDLGSITITETPSFGVLFANSNGFAEAESVHWRAPVTSLDGTVTLTAYSDHYTTVATLVIKIDGSYTFTMSAPVVHPTNQASEEEVSLKFKYTVTDFDQDSVNGSLTIKVDDDTPKITTPAITAKLDDEAQSLFPGNAGGTNDVTDAKEAIGNAGALFTAGADGVKIVTATPDVFSVIFKDANGLAGSEAITWSAGVQGANGSTTWTATSTHYDAAHPAATLVINADGSYKFTLNAPVKNSTSSATNEDDLTISIRYTVTDGDGDESTQSTLTIKVNDDTPTVGAQTAITVDEEGLGGNAGDTYATTNPHDAATSLASANGTLNYSFGADGASATTNVTFLTSNLAALNLTSGGQGLTYGWDQASHTLTAKTTGGDTVFTLQVTNVLTGAYTFTMSKPLDHLGANSANSEDDITIPFQFTITDGDGDTSATATVNVTINDDAPTFTAGLVENKTVDEEGIGGNPGAPAPYAGSDYAGEATTASGGLGVSWGADNGNSGTANRSLSFNGITEGAAVLNDANVAITSHGAAVKYHLVTVGDTQTLIGYTGNDANNTANYVFTVTLDDTTTTGTYNFTLFKNLDHPTANTEDDISIKFNFTAKDADKDTVTGSFKVTIDDDSPIITPASVQNGGVDEDNLVPSGNHDSAPGDLADDGTLVAHGSLGISYGADGPGVGAAANPGVSQTFDFTNHSTNIDPYLTVNAHFGVVGNAPVGALGGGQNAPVVITAADGHPFELDSVKLSFAGGPSLTSKITVIAKDVGGQTYTFDVSVQNVFNLDGSTPTTFNTAGSPIDGKQLVSVSFGVYGNQAAYVQVDDVAITRGAAPEVPGPVYFSDLGNAAANITVTDSDGNPVALNQLTSNGQAIHFALLDSVTLVAYTGSLPSGINASNVVFSTVLSGTGNGSYDFVLKGPLDHPKSGTEDDLVFSFNYTAKDYDGDTTSGAFKVTVDDDMPVITTPAAGENLVVNGQFTDNAGFAPPMSWGGQAAPADSDIKGWHIANNNLERNPANWYVQDPADGGRVVDLDATPGNVSLSQNFTNLQNGQSYTLTFDAAKPAGYDAKMLVFWNGVQVGTVTPNGDHFEQFSITVTAGSGTNTLEFREVGAADNGGTFLANVAMHATNAIVNEDSLSGGVAGGLGDATGTTASATGTLGIKWGADAGDVTDGAVQDGTTANALSDNVAALTGRAVYFTDSNSGASGLQPSVTAFAGSSAITLQSAGQEVHYQILENGTKLVGYTGVFNVASSSNWVFTVSLSDEGTGQYKFNLLKPLDHPMSGSEDDINLTFGFTARDADGDTANSTLTITVDDDTPVLVGSADTITVDETNTPFAQSGFGSLHVSMGADKGGAALSFGTDANGHPLHPAGLTSDGTPLDYELRTTQYGEKQLVAFKQGEDANNPVFIVALSSPANPTYIFTLFQNLDHAEGSNTLDLNFTIRVTDGDGDFVDRTVDVTVKDSVPTIPATTEQVTGVQDDALTGGNPEPGDTKTASGTLSHDFGADENGHLSWLNPTLPATGGYSSDINGNTLDVYQLQNSVNVKVFTVTLDPVTGGYTITQVAPIHHPDGNGETGESFNLNYRVTDGDTDYVDSHLKVIVGDDVPLIVGATTPVNLLTNGDFTGGSFPHAESWGHWATDGTGWKISGTAAGQTGVQLELIQSGYLGVVTSNGHPMVDLAASPGDVAISQTLNGLTVGQHYTLSFEIGASDPSSAGLEVYWNGNLVGTYHPGQITAIETLDLTAIAGANTVSFKEIGSADNTGTYLANVSLVQTPSDSLPVFHANIGEDGASIVTLTNGVDFNFGADGPGAVAFDTAHATMTTPTGTTLGMPTLSYDPATSKLTVDPGWGFGGLSEGEIATLTVPFTVTDSDGDTKTGIYQFTITGSNDDVRTSEGFPDAGTMTEYAETDPRAGSSTDRTYFDDPSGNAGYNGGGFWIYDDQGDTHTVTVTPPANAIGYVTAVVGEETANDGAGFVNWNYHVTDAQLNFLSVGETINQVFRITVSDGHGSSTYRDITVTLVGAEDAPQITVGQSDSTYAFLTETNSGLTTSGTLTVTDVDHLDTVHATVLSVTAGGSGIENLYTNAFLKSLLSVTPDPVLDANGPRTAALTWTFDSGNEAFNFLPNGWESVLNYTIQVSDGHGGYDTQVVQIKLHGTNDAPAISGATVGAVTEAGDIAGIDEAGLGGGLSVAAALLNGAVNGALSSLSDPTNLHAALTTVAGQVGGDLGKAIAIVWNYLDDAYVGAAPTDVPAINEAFTRLGIEYAIYLRGGGTPLTDVTGKYTADGLDAGSAPDRFQSLHDNLLGNLTSDALTQRYGASALHDILENLIQGVDANLLTRPYASGNESANDVAGAHAWDASHGYATHVSGTLAASDPDAITTLTWSSGTQNGTYGTFALDASGHWTYTLDNDRQDTQALKQGAVGTETFSVTVTDDYGATATTQVIVTVNGTNDAPMITSSVSTEPVSAQLHNVQQADATHTFEPAANLDGLIGAQLGIPTGATPDTAAGMKAVVLAVQTALGGGATFADAIAQVWDFLDENYQYYNTPVNHASVLLGLVYADYLQDGGQPLLDTIAKFTADGNADTIADRSQSLHDNLLGALDLPSIDDKFSSVPALRDYLLQQIHDAGLDGRPYYGGYQNEGSTAAHTWDQDHGLLPVASGQITATDVDTGHSLTWSIDGSATSAYGAITIDQTGSWHFTAADNAATQALAAGEQSPVQTFIVKVTDEFGASDSIAVSVVLTGTNDAPVISHVDQTVINAGFEADTSYNQSGPEGQYTNGSPSGWTVSGPTYGGWFDPTPNGAGGSTGVLQMPAENGNNVLWLNDGQTATQTLGNASMGIYQLNVEVGDRADSNLTGMPDFAVRLYAGTTLIAEKIVEHTTGDSFSWTLIKLEGLVDSTTAGQPLRIELANLEEPGSGGDFPQQVQVDFDNVSLSYLESRVLNPITEDDINNAGQTVASILGGSVTDVDHNALGGIAITHTNSGNGTWQYSVDGGAHWIDIGNPSVTSALLLTSTDLIRFEPNGVHGTTPSFDYVAWDQTSGTAHGAADVTNRGGTTAFSEDIGHAVISVAEVNDVPVLTADSANLTETSAVDAGIVPVNGTGNVLSNDTDADGDALSVIIIRAANALPGAQEPPIYITAGGSATAHGTYGDLVMNSDGSYTYVPKAAYDALPAGAEVTDVFKYGASDGHGGEVASYLTFHITGTNDTPILTADNVNLIETAGVDAGVAPVNGTGNVLTNDHDAEDTTLSVYSVRANNTEPGGSNEPPIVITAGGQVTAHGTYGDLVMNSDGSYAYTPKASYDGLPAGAHATDVFKYVVYDSAGVGVASFLTFNITGTNDAPVLDLSGPSVAGNDVTTTTVEQQPQWFVNAATITDVDSGTMASLKVTLTSAPDGALEVLSLNSAALNAVANSNLSWNFSSATGVLLVTGVAATSVYQIILDGLVYQNNSDNPHTTDRTIHVVVNDGISDSAQQTATLHVWAMNDAPVLAGSLAATIAEGGTHVISTTELGFTDPDDVESGVTFIVSNQVNGIVMLDGIPSLSFTGQQLANGQVTFVHNGSETLAATFDVKVEDGNEDGSTPTPQTFHFNVTPVNDAPVIDSHTGADLVNLSIAENTATVTTVHATDPDGPTITYTISGGDDASLFTVNSATGALSFINAPDFENPLDTGHDNHYNVTVKASDGTLFDTQSFDIAVTDVTEVLPHTTIADASPYYAFSNNAYAASVSQPATINFDADNIFGGGSDTFTYTFTNVYGPSNWLTINAAQGTVTGDPSNLSALSVYRIDAVDTVTHEHSFTYVAFSALPDSNAQYVQITNSASYNDSWKSDVVQVAAGSTVPGSTVISGASGSDVLIGNDNANTLDGSSETDALYGMGGNDILYSNSSVGFLSGGDGNDRLYAGSDSGYLLGGAGNDELYGSGNADVLMGGAGNDTIVGNGGKDLIVGGEGNDTLTGGSVRDTYVFMEAGDNNVDRITNYDNSNSVADQDVIDLSYLLDSISTDKASHVRFQYSDAGHSTHVLSDPSALPAVDGDVTIQVNTTGTWQSVVTIADTGSNMTTGSNAIQMMLDHATVQQFHA